MKVILLLIVSVWGADGDGPHVATERFPMASMEHCRSEIVRVSGTRRILHDPRNNWKAGTRVIEARCVRVGG